MVADVDVHNRNDDGILARAGPIVINVDFHRDGKYEYIRTRFHA